MKPATPMTHPTLQPEPVEKETYIPDLRRTKLVYLILSVVVLGISLRMLWTPLGRFLLGERAVGHVNHIVRAEPGRDEEIIRYRRAYAPEKNWAVRFQHHVTVRDNGKMTTKHLGVDSRIQPYANVNDRVTVMFYPGESTALEVWNFRTWGFGLAYLFVGFLMVVCAIPTYLAVGKPIEIDVDAIDEEKESVNAS